MEVATIERKKKTITKWKLKKNIKNVLCRPDKLFWPELNEDEAVRLESALKKYKVEIPHFDKPHWNELRLIPKENRPKPSKVIQVDGLLFGIKECTNAIQSKECAAVIIESKVNPKLIVQPLIEKCKANKILVLCLPDLRKVSKTFFGIPTSCLGVRNSCLLDLQDEITDIAKKHPLPKQILLEEISANDEEEKMDVGDEETVATTQIFSYLYRTNKKTRVFNPNSEGKQLKNETKFTGQDFIEFSEKPQKNNKKYLNMVMKRISNNPDRVKKK